MNPNDLDSPSRRRLLVAAVPLTLASAAWAQARTAHIVVGFAPGGAADGLARLMSGKLRGVAGTTVVVDNRVGAGARIAIDYTRVAPADGSVMVLVPDATMFLYPHVYKSLNYDVFRDFTPIGAVAVGPQVLLAWTGLPVNNVRELVAHAKA
ncbi:MAG TPA: tripartite tricarboxylate transporter substrate-binding protein, partial [Ramlibacter sp.]|nr:tripartite tricarboxylate transporter substrate-binding protein [Ramlibacter sp.]